MNTDATPPAAAVAARRSPCPMCGEPVEGRPLAGGGGRERGSCRRCGLQLVRRPEEGWREIRG